MESSRRQKGEIRKQEMQGTRSQNRKPPVGIWQPTVPSWEKKFCTTVGSVPWHKLLETKKLMYLYDNVVRWNDSAGEEAFHNAKSRFWAHINGFPCDISLLDPDMYIDEIDWNASIDLELLLDLERQPMAPGEGEKDEHVVIFGSTLLPDQSFFCASGWGDAEEDLKKATNLSPGPGFRDCDKNLENEVPSGPDKCWNNRWENNHNKFEENADYRRTDEFPGTCHHGHSQNRENSGWNTMSRYKTSRFLGDDYQRDRGWRNGGGRKRISAYERAFNDENPASRQWHLNSYGPVCHYGSGKKRIHGVARNQFGESRI